MRWRANEKRKKSSKIQQNQELVVVVVGPLTVGVEVVQTDMVDVVAQTILALLVYKWNAITWKKYVDFYKEVEFWCLWNMNNSGIVFLECRGLHGKPTYNRENQTSPFTSSTTPACKVASRNTSWNPPSFRSVMSTQILWDFSHFTF